MTEPDDATAAAAPPANPLADLSAALKVLGNEKRLHLLRFLAVPHYIEEIASELKVARQTALKHVEQMVELGVLQRLAGRRPHGAVVEYMTVPQKLFTIFDELGRLGSLETETSDDQMRSRNATDLLGTMAGAEAKRGARHPVLTIVYGLPIGRTLQLTGSGPWIVGRDTSSPACLEHDPFISLRHAELRCTGAKYELVDLFSSNGTSVDGKPLERGATAPLSDGSIVRLGKTLLVFRTTMD
ncbi:MAG: FHA domain-containing protein [Thermoplasmatota archaeon]